jgi:molecular chaperone DnaK
MVKDAESHAEDDRRQRELAEARNLAENAAYQAEKQLGEMGDQIDSSAKEEVERAIADVKGVLESDNAEEIKAKTDALQSAFHKVSEQIYQAAAAEQQAAQSAGGDGASADRESAEDEEVVDAEVVDEDGS